MLTAATCSEALANSAHVTNAAAACGELLATLQRRCLSEDASFATFDDVQDWIYLACVIVVVACAAMAAGLTMGVTSLESSELRVIARTGTPTEKRQAATLLP
jgi:predicted Abi (CAAX) family protease